MKTITFYSYKGGVGRTLALANFARHLASHDNKKVFVLDLDLEAPGVHYKLPPTPMEDKSDKKDLGVVSYIKEWQFPQNLEKWQSPKKKRIPKNLTKYIYEHKIYENKSYKIAPSDTIDTINVMPAGNSGDPSYWYEVAQLNWHSIFLDSLEDK